MRSTIAPIAFIVTLVSATAAEPVTMAVEHTHHFGKLGLTQRRITFGSVKPVRIAQAVDRSSPPPRRIAGYRGIWFSLGQYYGRGDAKQPYSERTSKPTFPYGDKYSGGLGTYTAKHTPMAIYVPEVEKTFFVYGGTTEASKRHLLCMISYYDHKNHTVPMPVVVHDKGGVDDPHDNPSLAIDRHGYLWVFISGRARHRPGFKYRSLKPYRMEGFERISQEEMTYPQPHVSSTDGFLHLFTKYTGVRELYWESSRDGHGWSADQKLAGIREPGHSRGGHYQTSARHGHTIGTFFNRHPDGIVDQRTDLYYVQTSDMGKTWTTVEGLKLHTPLLEVSNPACIADFASKRRLVYLKDMTFDNRGRPMLLYISSAGHEPGPPNAPRYFHVTRWDGEAWRTSTICPTDHNYDMGTVTIEGHRWVARLPSAAGPQPNHTGGEIVVWESTDSGASWKQTTQLTRNSEFNHGYVRHPINAHDPFFVYWADGDPTRLSPSHLYFANSTGTGLWRLPYEMTTDVVKPQRVVTSKP